MKRLSKPGLQSILLATLVGIPLPFCSCSVIPIAVALWRSGASAGACVAFLVSCPEIGFDSISLTLKLIGEEFLLARLLLVSLTAIIAGLLVDHFSTTTNPWERTEPPTFEQGGIVAGLKYAYTKLLIDLAPALCLGFLIAGIAQAFTPELSSYSESLLSKPLAFLISLPVYICAVAATPLGAVLLAKGLSAGTVMIYLLAGPASNFATFTVLASEWGKKTSMIYFLTVASLTIAGGYIIDGFLPELSKASLNEGQKQLAHHSHHLRHDLFLEVLPSIALIILLAWALFMALSKAKQKKNSSKPCCGH